MGVLSPDCLFAPSTWASKESNQGKILSAEGPMPSRSHRACHLSWRFPCSSGEGVLLESIVFSHMIRDYGHEIRSQGPFYHSISGVPASLLRHLQIDFTSELFKNLMPLRSSFNNLHNVAKFIVRFEVPKGLVIDTELLVVSNIHRKERPAQQDLKTCPKQRSLTSQASYLQAFSGEHLHELSNGRGDVIGHQII